MELIKNDVLISLKLARYIHFLLFKFLFLKSLGYFGLHQLQEFFHVLSEDLSHAGSEANCLWFIRLVHVKDIAPIGGSWLFFSQLCQYFIYDALFSHSGRTRQVEIVAPVVHT
jgi:hypothetical protein